ncbi:general transcription factor II-I repeat domain-containing protein 2 [Biomphalaria glabrata]|nr:general transcription factor II-I repeat domain-containing protein 2 [Biomphalaria glabrata]
MLECASYLLEDFQNKDKIIQRIKDLPISRNTVKARVMKLHVNIQDQLKKDINACQAYSICLDESTDVTSSARLAIIAKYSKGNEIHEELIKLATLPTTTTGADICQTVVTELRNAGVDIKKIVSITTDGAPSMTGKDTGFVTLFTGHVGHPLITFHCIVHQQALCSKNGLKELEDIMKCVAKTVDFITARALNKRKFEQLLNEVQSSYSGLLMYNNVRWLSRGHVLERFVECLDEIRIFMDDNKQNCSELTNVDWLIRLMFFYRFIIPFK